jgi:hypothetical protein
MKENATPAPPGNDAPDPLLAALQQRLGDYGAAPPPGAWAGIRQRLPLAPRPWWRRPRRLLPLLALLLGLVATTAGVRQWRGVGDISTASATSKTVATGPKHPATHTQPTGAPAKEPAKPAPFRTPSFATRRGLSALNSAASQQANASRRLATTTPPINSLPGSTIANAPLSTAASAHAAKQAGAARPALNDRLPTKLPTAEPSAGLTTPKRTNYPVSRLLATGAKRRRALVAEAATTGSRAASRLATTTTAPAAHKPLTLRTKLQAHQLAGTFGRPPQATTRPQRGAAPTPAAATPALPTSTSLFGLASRRQVATKQGSALRTPHPQTASSTLFTLAADTLGLSSVGLVLPLASPLPAPLAGRPDSLPPAVPVRRWALLAVAGPTLSYRTLGATTPAATTAPRPDFARLERPALGFGAQVQVRRVLSGRWALAVGLGYQEYATRLALQVATDTTSASVHQRDTYRLLTLPVQLGYALGAPRGRLAKALLVGAEVGWYQGGRSTEGNDCGCQQTAYTATASPYRPRTLALSLGLDLRYRVGGPAGRWQWVVQPTGRYVLTPFTSATAAGFTARQPFSLGLLTGFSWDIR